VKSRVRTINNILLHSFNQDEYKRITITIVNDNIRAAVWQADIRDCVFPTPDSDVCMVGVNKDSDSWWLDSFGWAVESIDIFRIDDKVLSSTHLRNHYFSSNDEANEYYSKFVPAPQIIELNRFRLTEDYAMLKKDFDYKVSELSKFELYPYKDNLNCSTADTVVICNGHLLVTTRGNMPGLGLYALPGGHKNSNETYLDCAIRELREEVKLHVPSKVIYGSIRDQKIFDHPKRSSILCKPTLAVNIELMPNHDGSLPEVRVGDEICRVQWMPLNVVRRNQNQFFDDHYQIVSYFTGL
jgi:bifunctional NMN adenylyltransferase/nudix hydrolase